MAGLAIARGGERQTPALLWSLVLATLIGAATASERDSANPLEGMAEVTASKGLGVTHVDSDDPLVARGEYLVGLLGCASCHTDGALIGEPESSLTLAGSTIGIAFTNPMEHRHPGVVFPPNLTPDEATGLGDWTEEEIVNLLQRGEGRHGRQNPIVMPWVNYARLHEEDARAVARYLQNLTPIRHRVPKRINPGTPTKRPIVHVGLYRSQ